MRKLLSAPISLLVFVATQVAFAQVPFPGQCPDVQIMGTFDLDAYMGIWYENSKYPFVFEIGKKCIYATYENIGNNTVSVVNSAINRFTGSPSNVTGTAKVIAPAQLAVTFNKHQRADRANYLVLDTDYNSYAVVYSCTNLTSFIHSKIVWILTRLRQPTEQSINAAKKVLDDNNITQAVLIDTVQNDCPDLDDNTVNGTVSPDDFATTVLPNAIEKA